MDFCRDQISYIDCKCFSSHAFGSFSIISITRPKSIAGRAVHEGRQRPLRRKSSHTDTTVLVEISFNTGLRRIGFQVAWSTRIISFVSDLLVPRKLNPLCAIYA